MQKVTVPIVYHSKYGHTKKVTTVLQRYLKSRNSTIHLISVQEAMEKLSLLHASDTIIFGCPTDFGNMSAPFKEFMESTNSFLYKQSWKDKLAAGFTVSSTNGDKLNTLVSLSLFSAQHSMIWISQGVLPRFINGEQTDGQNRLCSYLGLMVQCDCLDQPLRMHPGDRLTTGLFDRRILDYTINHNSIKN